MKSDMNPSMICGVFNRPKVYQKLIKEIDGKHGMTVREIRFIEISMPVNNQYNDAVNHLKHFTNPILYHQLSSITNNMFIKPILKRYKIDPITLPKWETDNRHPLLYSGLTPILVETKYATEENYTDEELKNIEKLKKFESDGYKPIITGVYEK